MTISPKSGTKGVNETTTFTLDWRNWLAPTQDSIFDCDAFSDQLEIENLTFGDSDCTATVSGGVVGQKAYLTMRIHCESGDVFERSIPINIKA